MNNVASKHADEATIRLVKVPAFAAMVGFGLTKAWQAIGQGEVAVVRHGRVTRVRVDSIQAFIDAHTVTGDR